ncbi:hypothetical protein [Paenibacillus sp. MER TA 81-3]|uniref:hypothetical protein n=1 Tax=Paenibacillus sp. MER TA 81-3 TaxID=2939573 RepID=UPI0034D97122
MVHPCALLLWKVAVIKAAPVCLWLGSGTCRRAGAIQRAGGACSLLAFSNVTDNHPYGIGKDSGN